MTSITDKIIVRIKHNCRGWVFGPADFMDIDTRVVIGQVLSGLVKQNFIRRLSRGIYDYPKKHKLLGTLLPSAYGIARVMADGDVMFPSGAMAANMLGLSTQVPAKPVYVTNFTSRTRTVGNQTITLKRAKIPIIHTAPDKVNLVLQALSYLGESSIDDVVINKCTLVLSNKDIESMHVVVDLLPSWMGDAIRKIALIK